MKRMKRPVFSWKAVALIAGLLVLAYLGLSFNSRIAEMRRLTVQRDAVASRMAALEQTRTALRTQVAETTSEAAVREWAYQEGNMAQPGDIPVVPLAQGGTAPAPTAAPVVSRPVLQNWEMWLWLFSDESN